MNPSEVDQVTGIPEQSVQAEAQKMSKTAEIVKQTAPVLAQKGVAITTCFYDKLFSQNPSLRGVFNMSHQVKDELGSAPQPRALAEAVHAYAANIDNLGALTSAVMKIAHKHVSVGVTPEQYPIVGENLLNAMQEVLGDAATPEIVAAWGEAYGALAKIFIDTEEGIRSDLEKRPGGWRGWRQFRVEQKIVESSSISSFYLKPVDGRGICPFSAGQYTCLRLNVPGLEWPVQRNYTISCPPGKDYLRISVKKQEPARDGAPAGLASHYLHDQVDVGDILELAPPCGETVLDENPTPLVLLSAGVGLTPMTSMLHTAAADTTVKRQIIFIHGSQDMGTHAMKAEVEEVAKLHSNVSCHFFYSQQDIPGCRRGRVTAGDVLEIVGGTGGEYYLCGPQSFLKDVKEGLLAAGVEGGRLHCHTFGPSL